jgi:hypothetical protein
MSESKYGKYIIAETPKSAMNPHHLPTLWVNNELNGALKGAFYLMCALITKADDETTQAFKPHNHDFDEYIGFLGTNPEDPTDLGGEVEIWLGGEEKHVITKSCAVFVPRGLYHTPITIKRVDRPMVHFRTGNTLRYENLSYSKDPKWAHLSEPPEIVFE